MASFSEANEIFYIEKQASYLSQPPFIYFHEFKMLGFTVLNIEVFANASKMGYLAFEISNGKSVQHGKLITLLSSGVLKGQYEFSFMAFFAIIKLSLVTEEKYWFGFNVDNLRPKKQNTSCLHIPL